MYNSLFIPLCQLNYIYKLKNCVETDGHSGCIIRITGFDSDKEEICFSKVVK